MLLSVPDLVRKAVAEAVGTGFLVATVIGSGIAAQRLSPGQTGLQLLENSTATVGVLVALILALGAVSGAHLNPVVSLAERLLGRITTVTAATFAGAQIVGGCIGAMVANVMFDLDAVNISTHARTGSGVLLGEVVATFGLLLVILGVAAGKRHELVPFAVAGYIGAAYWFTSSTSFANPAVTVARTLSDTFAGIAPSSAPAFIAAEVVGALLAVAFAVHVLNPTPADPAAAPAPAERPST